MKSNADSLSIPLFDYTQFKVDNNNQSLLSNLTKQLSNICIIFEYMCKNLGLYIKDKDSLEQQYVTLQMVSDYLKVMQWLLNVKLLPEVPMLVLNDESNLSSVPYPVGLLTQYYNERRTQIKTFNKMNCTWFKPNHLFIDYLIDDKCDGTTLTQLWKDDGGNGLYPPPSIQSLLHVYLLDNVDVTYKHCIIMYIFLDLAIALDRERYKVVITNLIKFPAVFKLSSSILKVLEGFWQLDHADFDCAIKLLIDPLISANDLRTWHHRIVLSTLLSQNQGELALLYMQVRRPCFNEITDHCMNLSLLVVNKLLDEAFYFYKQNVIKDKETQLLKHLFQECIDTNQLGELIQYKLTSNEEQTLMKYLDDVKHPNADDIKAKFYLRQSRHSDVLELKNDAAASQLGLIGQENSTLQAQMMKSVTSKFPDIVKKVLGYCNDEKQQLVHKVMKPKPMSVFLHNAEEQTKYKSSVIYAAVAKARETLSEAVCNRNVNISEMPFMRNTSTAPHTRKRHLSILPEVTNIISEQGEFGPSPMKHMKLSPRKSTDSFNVNHRNSTSNLNSSLYKLSTPLVKGKVLDEHGTPKSDQKQNTSTPQSILKVRRLYKHTSSDDLPENIKDTSLNYLLVSEHLDIKPRKSLVRFEKRDNSSTSNTSNGSSRKSRSEASTSKCSSVSAEETYHSFESTDNTSKEKHEEIIVEKGNIGVVKEPNNECTHKNSVIEINEKRSCKKSISFQEVICERALLPDDTSITSDFTSTRKSPLTG